MIAKLLLLLLFPLQHQPPTNSLIIPFAVETPENSGGDLLLSSEFLKECVEQFSVPSRGFDTNSRSFPPKHLNIVDPLKENNNLGRSVSKGRDHFCSQGGEARRLFLF